MTLPPHGARPAGEPSPPFTRDVAVLGGAGHIGLPLALTFVACGLSTAIYDLDERAIGEVRAGRFPFLERGGPEALSAALASGRLTLSSAPEVLASCRFVVCTVGTPVDEHLNPRFSAIHRAIDGCGEHLRDGQVFVLRSTVFPGLSEQIREHFRRRGLAIDVAFCPERVAQGQSLEEFRSLPQLVSAFDQRTLRDVSALFARFTLELIELAPMEAELCKLMTNAWRYLQFAAVNQFYMIATEHGLDFARILHGCRHHYPRMDGMPGPGLAAGPCLFKDTMQLAAFSHNGFMLGHAAMVVNEGLPNHLIALARERATLRGRTVGILGMAFKAGSDDPRDSLSYKLRKLLQLEAGEVLCCDPYVRDATLVPLAEVLARAEVLFVATPHREYRGLAVPAGRLVVDVWNCLAGDEEEPVPPQGAPR